MQKYIRVFLPLTNESKGYEYRGNTPAGRCLLESRGGLGKLILWAQNLKPEALYKVHLIFKTENGYAGLVLCPLFVHPNGKAETRFSFNAANIEGYGVNLDSCLAVAVIDGKSYAPLCGYKEDNPLPWRNGFEIMSKDIPNQISKAPVVEEEVPTVISTDSAPIENCQSMHIEVLEPEQEKADETELTEKFKEEVEQLLKSHTPIHPFQKQSREVDWVRISLNENLTLPDHICSLLTEAFIERAYRQYNHLILGKSSGEGPKRYYIGVPALYDPADKIAGFRQFKCSEGKKPNPGDFGYWLIFMPHF